MSLDLKWSEQWLLRFNSKKCKVLHLGYNNPKYNYLIKEGNVLNKLEESLCEKDLGVFVDCNLNFDEHISTIVKKARMLSGLILRTFHFKTSEILVPLFKALIRPILEYANPVWSPYELKDMTLIEKVQRHFTKQVQGMKDLNYSQRLASLNLPSLEYRRVRGDLIETYKILNNKYDPLTTSSLLTLSSTKFLSKSHDFKLYKSRSNHKYYQMFFTNRIISLWNGLPEHVINAKSLNCFKNNIDQHLKSFKFATRLGLYTNNY